MARPSTTLVLAATLSWISCSDSKADINYTTRTRSFSGFGTSVRGDIRTVGMSGATVGLGDTFIAAGNNPAGLAMTMPVGDLNFTSNNVHDSRIQDYSQSMSTTNFGTALNAYPWGFSLGYVAPYREGQNYILPSFPNNPTALSVTVRELQMGVAHVFMENRLSLGLGLTLGQSEVEYEFSQPPYDAGTVHSYALGFTLGAMWRFPQRVLLGWSYRQPMHYKGDPGKQMPGISNFFQPVDVPGRMGFGMGWIPNRFFRADFSLFIFGNSTNTALLRDDNAPVGKRITFQPRLGAAYQFIDYRELSGTFFLGSYYETMRIQGALDRIHLTTGVETKPWIFTIGWGIDRSAGYRNYLVTLSIDIFKVMEKLDLIPRPWHPPHGGFLPPITFLSDEGLARPLVKDWIPQGPQIDPIQVGLDIPRKVEEKVKSIISPEESKPAVPKSSSKKPSKKKSKKKTPAR